MHYCILHYRVINVDALQCRQNFLFLKYSTYCCVVRCSILYAHYSCFIIKGTHNVVFEKTFKLRILIFTILIR